MRVVGSPASPPDRRWRTARVFVSSTFRDMQAERQALVRVVDDDPPPAVSIDDAAVAASPLLPVAARVVVRLDRERDRDLPLVVRSDLGPVRVVVPAFARHATGTVTVPVGRPRDAVQQVALHAAGAHATLTIRPPAQTRREAGLAAIAGVRWPTVRLSGLL